jgi:hypothetical protein
LVSLKKIGGYYYRKRFADKLLQEKQVNEDFIGQ